MFFIGKILLKYPLLQNLHIGYFIGIAGGITVYPKDQRETWINWSKDNYQIIYNLYFIILQFINQCDNLTKLKCVWALHHIISWSYSLHYSYFYSFRLLVMVFHAVTLTDSISKWNQHIHHSFQHHILGATHSTAITSNALRWWTDELVVMQHIVAPNIIIINSTSSVKISVCSKNAQCSESVGSCC